MNKPTEEQVERFWLNFGMIYTKPFYEDGSPNLPIDLNTLFKYAVPKLPHDDWQFYAISFDYDSRGYSCRIDFSKNLPDSVARKCRIADGFYDDPALALFWAIYKVIEGGLNES